MPTINHLLGEIVDYAGLFPPAALPLPEVVKNYRDYVDSDHQWMLARLIIPAMKLPAFAETYRELFPEGLEQPKWRISALVPPVNADADGWSKAWSNIHEFNHANSHSVVDAIEGKLPSLDLLNPTIEGLPAEIAAFLEIPHSDPNDLIQALSKVDRPNTYAKIRTGGVTEDLIPDPKSVANFISQCAVHQLGFKATAGLHHPVRNEYSLTYESDSPCGTMHGFLNLFSAAALAYQHDWNSQQLLEVLNTSDKNDFSIEEGGLRFRKTMITTEQLDIVRKSFAISFGSCSFVEPIEDLFELGWLANDAKTV